MAAAEGRRGRFIAEGAFAATCLVAGLVLYVITPQFVRGWAFNMPGTTDVALEPAFFPRLLAVLVMIASLAVIATMPMRKGALPLAETRAAEFARAGLGAVGILVYLLSLEVIGFVTASTLFVVIATLASGYRRLVVVIPTAIVAAVGLRLVFRFGLKVNLPTGLFY